MGNTVISNNWHVFVKFLLFFLYNKDTFLNSKSSVAKNKYQLSLTWTDFSVGVMNDKVDGESFPLKYSATITQIPIPARNKVLFDSINPTVIDLE